MAEIFDLAGRNVLITGGGRGLGKAMALGLAARGANIAVFDIAHPLAQSSTQEIQALGVKTLALEGDVTRSEDAVRAVDAVVQAWGGLDVLVNNAGIAIQGAAEETSLDQFKRVYEIDVFGVLLFSQAAFRPMSARERGVIINISSTAGIVVPTPQKQASYNSAKAAVILLTKSLAFEWAPYGIRVNAIAPGFMLTPPLEKMKAEDPERWNQWMARVPLHRAGQPEELQGAVIFLASDSSSYVTGQTIVVDGGMTSV
jgi:NAD(P)-dependent dehydrogenase (short-subunit alcohol dehydrogenase family)